MEKILQIAEEHLKSVPGADWYIDETTGNLVLVFDKENGTYFCSTELPMGLEDKHYHYLVQEFKAATAYLRQLDRNLKRFKHENRDTK